MTTTPEYPTYAAVPAQETPEAPVVPATALDALTAHTETPEAVPEAEDKMDLASITETLNGYDQIAIRARFHERFDQLAEDPMMLARALYFVHLRRQSFAEGRGHEDGEAFEAAMSMPMSEMNELFDVEGEEDSLEGDESAIAERDREFANFVIGTGVSYTLDQYMELSVQQRARMIEAASRR